MDTGVLDRIAEKLRDYPQLSWDREERSVFVEAPVADGFSVWFSVNDHDYVVGFDGWHEHFTDLDTALNLFAMGFTDSCRLLVVRRNGIPVKWTVEVEAGGSWKARSTTGKAFIPFWVEKEVVVRRNPTAEKAQEGAS